MSTYTLTPYRSKNGWRLQLRAPNGKVPMFEAYQTRGNALRAARRVAAAKIVVVEK